VCERSDGGKIEKEGKGRISMRDRGKLEKEEKGGRE